MKTADLIANFMKGSRKASISEKQKSWLLGQAKKEGIAIGFNGFNDTIYFEDCYYQIKNCKRLASGGSYVGSRIIHGRYNIEKLYAIRFTEPPYLTGCYNQCDIDHFNRERIPYEIIKPTINTSTR